MSRYLGLWVAVVFSLTLLGHASADTLRIALSTLPGPLDPAVAPAPEQLAPIDGAYETLIGPGDSPSVAASWDHDAVGLIWRFRIAPGHLFDDGTKVDAAAVKFSLDRLIALGRGPASDAIDNIASVKAPDPTTLVLVLKAPTPRILSILHNQAASIVNPAVARHALGSDWGSAWLATRTAGSGPYVLTPTSGGVYTLGRNRFYSGPHTAFERLQYRVVADPTVRALSVSRGDVDVAFLMPSQTLRRLKADPALRIVSSPALAFQNLAFNLQRQTFKDRGLRFAVAEAIDTRAIIRDIRGGYALPFAGPLGAGMIGADASLYSIRYDPADAMRLARAAGLRRPTLVHMIYPGVSPETDTVAQYIQAALAPLGLQVRLERLSIPAYENRMQRGAYDLVLMGFVCRYADASSILNFWFDPAKAGVDNPARFNNPEVTGLITRSARTINPANRAVLNRRIASLVNADLPYVYLQQTKVTNVVRRDIQGYAMDPEQALSLPLASMRREP